MTTNINIPVSMLKRLLNQHGARVQPETVTKFKQQLLDWATEKAKIATEKSTMDKRKTLMPTDLD